MIRSPTKSNLDSDIGEEIDDDDEDYDDLKRQKKQQQRLLPLILKRAKGNRNLAKLKLNKDILSLPLVNLLSIKHEIDESENQIEYYIDDWSEETCDLILISPMKKFLNVQHRREQSSRRRCMQIEARRKEENSRKYAELCLKEFDDRVNLSLLLKKNKLALLARVQQSNSNLSLPNYKALLAREILRRNASCHRCVERNKKYEENAIKNLINYNSTRRMAPLRK
jgi:hypothetical protein